jgi:hypothetical protein
MMMRAGIAMLGVSSANNMFASTNESNVVFFIFSLQLFFLPNLWQGWCRLSKKL